MALKKPVERSMVRPEAGPRPGAARAPGPLTGAAVAAARASRTSRPPSCSEAPLRPPGRRRKGPRERLPAARLIRDAGPRGRAARRGRAGWDRRPRGDVQRTRAARPAASRSVAGAAARPSEAAAQPS